MRHTDIGFCKSTDIYDISNLPETKFRKKISAVFHSVKSLLDKQTATFYLNNVKLLSFIQKSEDSADSIFLVTVYEDIDEKTVKLTNNNLRKSILKLYGFDVPPLSDEDDAEADEIEIDNTELDGIETTKNGSVNYAVSMDGGFNDVE